MASRRTNVEGLETGTDCEDDLARDDFVPGPDFAPDLAVWAPDFFLFTLEVISSEVSTQRLRPRCDLTCLETEQDQSGPTTALETIAAQGELGGCSFVEVTNVLCGEMGRKVGCRKTGNAAEVYIGYRRRTGSRVSGRSLSGFHDGNQNESKNNVTE
jgi:hypothetical protein